ncbi:hypothetical protein GIB67_029209 [Kingdonia uniflora]|uniref:Protein FAR1-RELATED SEQUENCE n=1 Tax=Kingdonia uniflora TaxID=39325 RepID=A0A7J7NAZ6_9MAGN|nr:hypothetical protein GIB67_029209 [Kingdonia uniflora]
MDLMKKHKLDDNVWMQGIFNIRERWIPLWNRSTFFVGMSSTGRSESTNNFFNDWLSITIRLYSFVTKYEAALLGVYERESAEDFASEHRYRQVGHRQALLKNAENIYIRTMFYNLQDQFDQVVRFITKERHIEGNVRQLTVKSHSGRTELFELEIDLEKLTGNFGCKLFEYVGLPCCHFLKVFSKYDILKIVEAFIMTRWTIGVNKLSRSYDKNELESYLQNYDESFTQIDASQQNILASVTDSLVFGTMILNPLIVQTKGRAKTDHKKGAIWKGGMEEAVMKKKRTCKSCRVLDNHDKRTCPLLKTMIAKSRDSNGKFV